MEQPKIKIAVMGSCVTRDNFNSKFNPSYKEVYDCVLTQNQTSLISLMSKPAEYNEAFTEGMGEYDTWNVRTDFNKEFLRELIVLKPDYVIMDFFGDIHFGVVELEEGKYITNNRWMLWKAPYYKGLKEKGALKELKIEKDTKQYLDLWKKHADKFFAFLKKELPACKVIIHKARNAQTFLCSNSIKPLSTSGKVMKMDVAKMNKLWDELDQYVINKFDVHSIDLTTRELVSFTDHPWGLFYVHYTMDYYPEFLDRLHKIVLYDRLKDTEILGTVMGHILKHDEETTEIPVDQYRMEAIKSQLDKAEAQIKKIKKKIAHFEAETTFQFTKRKLKKYKLVRRAKEILSSK